MERNKKTKKSIKINKNFVKIAVVLIIVGLIAFGVFNLLAKKRFVNDKNLKPITEEQKKKTEERISNLKKLEDESRLMMKEHENKKIYEVPEPGKLIEKENPNPKSKEELKKELEEENKRSIERWNEEKDKNVKKAKDLLKKELKSDNYNLNIMQVLNDSEVLISVTNPNTTETYAIYKVDIKREYVDLEG